MGTVRVKGTVLLSRSYDTQNNITSYTDANGTLYKAYFDAWGNKIKTSAVLNGREVTFGKYEYDELGNLKTYKSFIDSSDYIKAEYVYDYLGRTLVNSDMINTYYAADALKKAYKVAFGEEFNVTTDSVYWELIGHIFADEVAAQNRGGLLESLWARVQKSTNTIDIGDDVIVTDGNRKFWDYLAGERKYPW